MWNDIYEVENVKKKKLNGWGKMDGKKKVFILYVTHNFRRV